MKRCLGSERKGTFPLGCTGAADAAGLLQLGSAKPPSLFRGLRQEALPPETPANLAVAGGPRNHLAAHFPGTVSTAELLQDGFGREFYRQLGAGVQVAVQLVAQRLADHGDHQTRHPVRCR